MRKKAAEIKVEIDYGRWNSEFCCWRDCVNSAEYPAPKLRSSNDNSLPERLHFCLEHIRAYNSAWDFFRGMSREEIEKFQMEAVIGHRPTKKIRAYAGARKFGSHLNFGQHPLFEFVEGFNKKEPPVPDIPAAEKQALAVLDLELTVSLAEIKERYKTLAKIHHPDIARSEKSAEKFKLIVEAYSCLKKSSYFC